MRTIESTGRRMAWFIPALLLFLQVAGLSAQAGVGINVGTPHASAALHIQSTEKGILIPRMTQAQRLAINSPANGLWVLQTNNVPGYFYFNGTTWVRLGGSISRLADLDEDTDVDLERWTDDDIIRMGAHGVDAFWISRNFYGRTLLGLTNQNPGHVLIGQAAGASLTTGLLNTALGDSALALNTTGLWATALGVEALRLNTTGHYNAALGLTALSANSTGSRNTAIGHAALYAATGSELTAAGYNSLLANTSGLRNTAIGHSALLSNGSGSDNTAVGMDALRMNEAGSGNTAVGHAALRQNTTGMDNTAIGKSALEDNSIGQANTAVGFRSLADNLSGDRNAAAGAGSLQALLGGDDNTAIGHEAMSARISGDANTAVGYRALQANLAGQYNTAIGFEAQRLGGGSGNTSLGFRSLENLTTGHDNTAVGSGALNQVTSGNRNLAIGAGADIEPGTLNNASAIGANAFVQKSNAMVLGSIAGLNNAVVTPRVGIGTTAPHPAALLDVTATTKAVLLPRMTNAQRNAIPQPANGLIVYSTTSHSPWMFNGSYWEDSRDPIGYLNARRGESLRFTENSPAFGFEDNYYPGFPALAQDEDGDSKIRIVDNYPSPSGDHFLIELNGSEALRVLPAFDEGAARIEVQGSGNNAFFKNFFFGHFAGEQLEYGESNTVIGKRAFESAMTGSGNTVIGAYALQSATSPNDNTAIGDHAMDSLTSGQENVAVGQLALGDCTTCSKSVGLGYRAMASVTNGTGFLGIGANSDKGPQAFSNATAIGANALVDASDALVLGSIAGVNGATADVNVGIGVTAPEAKLHLRTNRDDPTSNDHLILEDLEGEWANVHFNNAAGISGWQVRAKPDDNAAMARFDFRYASVNQLTVKGNGDLLVAGNFMQNSDRRLKTDLAPINPDMRMLDELHGYHFRWADSARGADLQVGLIAQEVEQILPHLVTTGSSGFKQVNYSGILPELLEIIKRLEAGQRERQALIDANDELIRSLEGMVSRLEDKQD